VTGGVASIAILIVSIVTLLLTLTLLTGETPVATVVNNTVTTARSLAAACAVAVDVVILRAIVTLLIQLQDAIPTARR